MKVAQVSGADGLGDGGGGLSLGWKWDSTSAQQQLLLSDTL